MASGGKMVPKVVISPNRVRSNTSSWNTSSMPIRDDDPGGDDGGNGDGDGGEGNGDGGEGNGDDDDDCDDDDDDDCEDE